MKIYQVSPLTAAIFLAILCMGVMGIFVILPIACIQWTWNSLITAVALLPQINVWQAGLLYLAFAATLYLLGVVELDIEAKGTK